MLSQILALFLIAAKAVPQVPQMDFVMTREFAHSMARMMRVNQPKVLRLTASKRAQLDG